MVDKIAHNSGSEETLHAVIKKEMEVNTTKEVPRRHHRHGCDRELHTILFRLIEQ